MRAITVRNLTLQFDQDPASSGDDFEQAQAVLEAINSVLQRQPCGFSAQIFTSGLDRSDVSGADIDTGDARAFDVTIEATVRKTIRVVAETGHDAIENAHSEFTTANTDEPEKYDEQLIGCKEVPNHEG